MEPKRRAPSEPDFSVVIPVLHEAGRINSAIEHLRDQEGSGACEIIVVDGDEQGGTLKAVRDEDVICLTSAQGRGRQMNAGAAVAGGEILVFLHADTRLPAGALKKIRDVLTNHEYVGGAFDLAIDSDRWILRYIAARASWRSRMNRIPYGDQAIFMRKSYFERIGGFSDIPIMEDVDLMRRIKKDGKEIHLFRDKVVTSARRWEAEGALYTTLRNRMLVTLYYLGVGPNKLSKFYKTCSNGRRTKQAVDAAGWKDKTER